jgi:hypothetical protein
VPPAPPSPPLVPRPPHNPPPLSPPAPPLPPAAPLCQTAFGDPLADTELTSGADFLVPNPPGAPTHVVAIDNAATPDIYPCCVACVPPCVGFVLFQGHCYRPKSVTKA